MEKIDEATYKLVGSVYSEVEKKEPWCRNAEPVTDIGLLTPEEFCRHYQPPNRVRCRFRGGTDASGGRSPV